MIKIIAAVDEELGIGKNNKIPWKYPQDLEWFRFETWSSKLVMGRKTFESIGKPLPGRKIFILSEQRSGEIVKDGQLKANYVNWDELTQVYLGIYDRVYVCGGESVYRQMLNLADELLLTHIPGVHACDRFFPEYDHMFEKEVTLNLKGDLKVTRWLRKNR